MKSAVQLWREFLEFCDTRTPDDLLALDFVRDCRRMGFLKEPLDRRQAARDLRTLQALLTWRERNVSVPVIASPHPSVVFAESCNKRS